MLPRLVVASALTFQVLLSVGCLGSHPETNRPQTPTPVVESDFKLDQGPSSFGSEIGGLSQEDVEEQFQALQSEFLQCVDRAADDLSWIGGSVRIQMRLDPAGRVRWVHLTDSTLGDRDTERCLLDKIRQRTWPRPLSGDGLAETTFEVEPSVRPLTWPRFKTSALAHRARAATRTCWKGVDGKFMATAYVEPGGRVIAAGVAFPNELKSANSNDEPTSDNSAARIEESEKASDCIAVALRELRVKSLTVAQRSTAKVSFSLP